MPRKEIRYRLCYSTATRAPRFAALNAEAALALLVDVPAIAIELPVSEVRVCTLNDEVPASAKLPLSVATPASEVSLWTLETEVADAVGFKESEVELAVAELEGVPPPAGTQHSSTFWGPLVYARFTNSNFKL
jgi:hypothetical protein